MKSFLIHAGLFLGGAAALVAGVFFPPAAPLAGIVGAKLMILGGGTALASAGTPVVTAIANAIGKKP